MRTLNSRLSIVGIMIALAVCGIMAGCVTGSGTEATKSRNVNSESPSVPREISISGAELYAVNCNRCHSERYPTEWNSAEWATALTHMRVRANLTAPEAREILKYLQANSGN